MSVYTDALKWSDERGDSGGAMRMRKALMSLYNWWWQFPIGEALANLDGQGTALLFACLTEYEKHGETAELCGVGDAIRQSGFIDGWAELLEASHDAQAAVRCRWKTDRASDDQG